MGYRQRLERDLDRWIDAGHVAPGARDAMLAMVAEPRRLDGATALAYVGAALLGLAVIAFTAANWDGLPRIGRFVLLLALFGASVGGGALALQRNRPGLANALTTLAALVFAASVGLVGQIFDIAGKPGHALLGSGVAAALLALSARSTGAAIAALILIGLGEVALLRETLWALTAAGALGALAAWSWRSGALAHAACMALILGVGWICFRISGAATGWLLIATVCAAGLAWLARQRTAADDTGVFPVFYGWAVWAALGYLALSGMSDLKSGPAEIPHRLAWMAAAGGAIALGRQDRHALITAGGVLFLIGAAIALLADLGVNLMTAAGLFLACALVALVGGFLLRRGSAGRSAP